jgi:hypothetical protein
VVISSGAEVIARHPRSYEREDFVFDPLHYLGDCQEFRAQRGGSTDYAMARVKRSPKRTAN